MKKPVQYVDFAELYDTLMDDVDYDRWAEKLVKLIERFQVKPERQVRLLDCAAGTGAFSIRFAKRGYQVTALDISEGMLRIASEKARLEGLSVPFVNMDMRSISMHRRQDVVLSCCDGVNYLTSLDDVRAFFRSAYDCLLPDGLLLFDVSSEYKLSVLLGNNSMGEDREECTYLWENSYDTVTRLLEMNLHFFVKSNVQPGLWKRFDETHMQRAHTSIELVKIAEDCGFSVEYDADFETGKEAGPSSERLQFVLRRVGINE